MAETLPISVVIPAYNRAEMIKRSVASAFGQVPRAPAEVIVVDDASSDRTADVAEELGARVIRHEVNQGEGGARNTGFAAATHDWVGLLDSDDEWLPHLLAELWPHRADHVLVGGAYLLVREGQPGHRYAGAATRRPCVLRDPAPLVFPENFLSPSATIVRRDRVLGVGGFSKLKRGADLDLWVRLLTDGPGIAVPVPVTRYYLHDGQIVSDAEAMEVAHEQLAREYADRPWCDERLVQRTRGVNLYDGARRSLSQRDWRHLAGQAGGIVSHPAHAAGVAQTLLRRERLRRRGSAFDDHGRRTVVDLRASGVRGVAGAILRPPGAALVGSRGLARVLRAAVPGLDVRTGA